MSNKLDQGFFKGISSYNQHTCDQEALRRSIKHLEDKKQNDLRNSMDIIKNLLRNDLDEGGFRDSFLFEPTKTKAVYVHVLTETYRDTLGYAIFMALAGAEKEKRIFVFPGSHKKGRSFFEKNISNFDRIRELFGIKIRQVTHNEKSYTLEFY